MNEFAIKLNKIYMENREIKEELAAMGAVGHYVPEPQCMPSPLTIDGILHHVEMIQRKLADVSSGLIDMHEANEMLDTLSIQFEEKQNEFDTLAVSYTALSDSLSKDPRDYHEGGRFTEQLSAVDEIWNKMSRLREEIWQLNITEWNCLDGKRVVNGKEWMEQYDALNETLRHNRDKMLEYLSKV